MLKDEDFRLRFARAFAIGIATNSPEALEAPDVLDFLHSDDAAAGRDTEETCAYFAPIARLASVVSRVLLPVMAAKKAAGENRVVVKVFLYGITPQIWRRFSISKEATFAELSDAIQAAMGWENKHPHEFRHGKGKRLVDVIGPNGLQEMVVGEFVDETQITIGDYVGKKRLPMRMLYRYDFADEYVHEVIFEKGTTGEGGPEMIGGERNCPQEDSGGTFQYMQALHGEIAWLHPGYEPEKFDIAAVDFTPRKKRGKK